MNKLLLLVLATLVVGCASSSEPLSGYKTAVYVRFSGGDSSAAELVTVPKDQTAWFVVKASKDGVPVSTMHCKLNSYDSNWNLIVNKDKGPADNNGVLIAEFIYSSFVDRYWYGIRIYNGTDTLPEIRRMVFYEE